MCLASIATFWQAVLSRYEPFNKPIASAKYIAHGALKLLTAHTQIIENIGLLLCPVTVTVRSTREPSSKPCAALKPALHTCGNGEPPSLNPRKAHALIRIQVPTKNPLQSNMKTLCCFKWLYSGIPRHHDIKVKVLYSMHGFTNLTDTCKPSEGWGF